MKILVVDDDPVIVNPLSEFLSDSHEVVSTSSPIEAIRLLKEHNVNLLIADYNMPNLNGEELANFAINAYGVKVIIMTGDVEFEPNHDMITVCYKPLSFTKLLKTISEYELHSPN